MITYPCPKPDARLTDLCQQKRHLIASYWNKVSTAGTRLSNETIRMSSQYKMLDRNSYQEDKMVTRSSYLHNENLISRKTVLILRWNPAFGCMLAECRCHAIQLPKRMLSQFRDTFFVCHQKKVVLFSYPEHKLISKVSFITNESHADAQTDNIVFVYEYAESDHIACLPTYNRS